jgi:hypothetical protein
MRRFLALHARQARLDIFASKPCRMTANFPSCLTPRERRCGQGRVFFGLFENENACVLVDLRGRARRELEREGATCIVLLNGCGYYG